MSGDSALILETVYDRHSSQPERLCIVPTTIPTSPSRASAELRDIHTRMHSFVLMGVVVGLGFLIDL